MADGFGLNQPLDLLRRRGPTEERGLGLAQPPAESAVPREANTAAAANDIAARARGPADDIAARARGPAPERNAGGVPDFEKNPLGAIGLVLTDIARDMSAVEGRADVACQDLSGPFLATSGHQAFYANADVSPAAIRPRRAQRTKIRMTART